LSQGHCFVRDKLCESYFEVHDMLESIVATIILVLNIACCLRIGMMMVQTILCFTIFSFIVIPY
jgi:hypothetical protein